MATRLKTDPYRGWKDPAMLTPYEEKIHALMQKGLTTREITDELGGCKYETVYAKIKVIKDKIQAAKWSQ